MKASQEHQPATQESVWEAFRETDRLIKESEARSNRERLESEAKFNREMAESRAKFDREMAESRAKSAESEESFNRRIKKLEKLTGGIANNQGFFAEEYFFNSFRKKNQNFFGEKFDEIVRNVKGIEIGFIDEYDILLLNGKAIGIIEAKYKAHTNDISKILKKATTFRINFPKYEKHKVYLGLATMVFYPELEQECITNGIAIIKQVGDTVVINDDHLKVY